MIEIAITPTMLQEAKDRFDFGELNGSITKGKGNLAGALGEVASIHYLKSKGYNIDDTSTYDYDFIVNGSKIDVKTKRVSIPPQPHYRVAVSAWNTKQRCDYYFFAYSLYDNSKVYLAGYYQKMKFFQESLFKKKGEGDEGENKDFRFSYDCYILENSKTKQFK